MDYTRVAHLYDTYVSTTFDIPFFLSEATKAPGEALELMAGTGRISIPLAEAGVRLTAVDRSPEMLAILQEKLEERGLAVDVQEMDIRHLSLPQQFALVFVPFHSFGELRTRADQEQALVAIHQHLSESGAFICTLHNPRVRLQQVDGTLRLRGKYALAQEETLLFWSREDYHPVTRTVHGLQLFERYDVAGTMTSRVMQEMGFYALERGEFEELVTATGFDVVALYGDYAYADFHQETSPFMILVLRKAGSDHPRRAS